MQGRALDLLRMLQQEMEKYQAERSDDWQESERGEAFQERLELITETIANLESAA